MKFPTDFVLRALLPAVAVVIFVLTSPAAVARDVGADPYYEYRDESETGEFSYDDSQDIPWIENETEVLAVPDPDNLSPVQLDLLPAGMELLIDKSRIDVNPDDRVVRVWLWVRSSAGAQRGTFEGFRCDTAEYKVYAYANPHRDPPVTKAKRPRWISLKTSFTSMKKNYRSELMQNFCSVSGPRGISEILQYLSGNIDREGFFYE
jgi:hypothetical protein